MKALPISSLFIIILSCKPSNAPDFKHDLTALNAWMDSIQLASADNQTLDSLSWLLINEEFNSQLEALNIQKLNEQEQSLLSQVEQKWKAFDWQYHHDMQLHIDSFMRAAEQDSIDADTSKLF